MFVISSRRLQETPGQRTGPVASILPGLLPPPLPGAYFLSARLSQDLPSLKSGSGALYHSPTRMVLPSTAAVCLYRVRAYVDSCWG